MLRAFCFFLTSLAPLALCLACVGCRKDEPGPASTAPPAGVTRCLHGIERALQATTVSETSKIYYEECADLFSDASCRDGWRAAAPAEPSAQLGIVADACKKSYCPALGAFAFAICKDDFVATPQSLARDWPPLFDAIVAREAGMSATEVSTALLAVYAHAAVLAAQSAAASASVGVPPASGSAAPPGPSAAPAASASAAPPTSSRKAATAPAKAGPPGPAPVPHPSAR